MLGRDCAACHGHQYRGKVPGPPEQFQKRGIPRGPYMGAEHDLCTISGVTTLGMIDAVWSSSRLGPIETSDEWPR